MRSCVFCFIVILAASCGFGFEVSVGTYVSNAGKTVTVPVALDSAAGLSYASVKLSYDPQVLVVTKAEAGTLKTLMSEDFVTTDANGTLVVSIYGSPDANVVGGSGSIANVTFAVRDGTDGLYSDVTVTDVQLGEITGVKDVTVDNPITTVNGMIRVLASSAAVARLENVQTICSDTTLASLELKNGDSIQAGSDAVCVSGEVTSETSAIEVKAPTYGWTSGKYALLSSPTADLAFTLEGNPSVEFSSEVSDGITTYYAAVTVTSEGEITCESEDLASTTKSQIRNYTATAIGKLDLTVPDNVAIKEAFDAGKPIKIEGPTSGGASVALISDMGLAPAPSVDPTTGELKLTYSAPTLGITSFDATTGTVGIKVTPGEGNSIVANINTGYVHVYGTDRLGEPMRYVSSVGFDMSKYLKSDTKGEGVLNVTLGTHTFLKVKVETISKSEGQDE